MAATVNGTDIAVSEVEAAVFDSEGGLTPEQMAQYLGLLVQWTAVSQRAEADFGLVPQEADIDARVQSLVTQLGGGASLEQFLESQGISEEGLRHFASTLVISEELRDLVSYQEVSEVEAQQALESDPASWTEVCASHILVPTEGEAVEALDLIQGGDEFGAVARQFSLDTTSAVSGGDLGCGPASSYVQEFANATLTAGLGEVVGPLETVFGFHLVTVRDRTVSSVAEVREVLTEEAAQNAVNDWIMDAILSAQVDVDARYGTWVTDPNPGVVVSG